MNTLFSTIGHTYKAAAVMPKQVPSPMLRFSGTPDSFQPQATQTKSGIGVFNLLLIGGLATFVGVQELDHKRERKADQAEIRSLREQMATQIKATGELAQLIDTLSERTTLDQLPKVVAEVAPATVTVGKKGSGVIIKISGDDEKETWGILTNNHVVQSLSRYSAAIPITFYTGDDRQEAFECHATLYTLPDGRKATSDDHDLALLVIPEDVKLPKSVRPAKLRNLTTNPLQVGESGVVIGSPFLYRDTVTSGIVSHLNRLIPEEPSIQFFQFDGPINPGNSGGGVFDMKGRLLGLATGQVEGCDGLGFVISGNTIKAELESIGIPVLEPGEELLKLPQPTLLPPP